MINSLAISAAKNSLTCLQAESEGGEGEGVMLQPLAKRGRCSKALTLREACMLNATWSGIHPDVAHSMYHCTCD